MIRRMLSMAVVAAIGLSGVAASAHDDPSPDGNRGAGASDNNVKRCDTYYRSGHESGSGDNKHSEDHTAPDYDYGDVGRIPENNGVPAGADTGVYVHSHTGHYVVRHDAAYVEVIGGGGYNRGGNQGGVVQGEVDPGSGAPDADFNVGTFAGTNGDMHDEHACIAAAGQDQVGDEGEQP